MNATVQEITVAETVARSPELRSQMAVEAARMARDNARHYRSYGNDEAARAAFERAYGYLDLARRWRDER